MKITVIDGQGGRIGVSLIREITERIPDCEITAVGTNSTATEAMVKAGAHHAATGENPVKVAARTANVITGPVGIVIADSLYGEVTPQMAVAVAQSRAVKVLIPVNKCGNLVAGTDRLSVAELITDAVRKIAEVK